jgi:excinuclease ABC subunit C
MSNDLDISAQRLYPYLKITAERFPRLLVTRKIRRDRAEYFGAFLPATGVRFFLDFLSKTFRLRTCTIDIDGRFDVPCPQFYARRCVAPCVRALCDEKQYGETVALARLFLRRENDVLREKFLEKIERAAARTDFEAAADWRDRWQKIENFRKKNASGLWLDDASDAWDVERRGAAVNVFLVTTHGRKTLGKRAFVFSGENFSDAEILERFLPRFYAVHAPAEIRLPADFPGRKTLAATLSGREGRPVKIAVAGEKNRKTTVERALVRTRYEFELKNIKPPASADVLQKELKRIFRLKRLPRRIEAFDAAHISGSDSAAGCAVWENGKFVTDLYRYWLFEEAGDLRAIESAVAGRFSNREDAPDLILIDGAAAQLGAAVRALENFRGRKFFVISAVKPPGRHGEISHFLTEKGEKILFETGSDAFHLLQRLRDEAHLLANGVHRARRDFSLFYELASALPSADEKTRRLLWQKAGSIKNLKDLSAKDLKAELDGPAAEAILRDLENYKAGGAEKIAPPIVPIRYDDPNGDARDLQPLSDFSKAVFG